MRWDKLAEILEKWKKDDTSTSATDVAIAIEDLIDSRIRENEDGGGYDD